MCLINAAICLFIWKISKMFLRTHWVETSVIVWVVTQRYLLVAWRCKGDPLLCKLRFTYRHTAKSWYPFYPPWSVVLLLKIERKKETERSTNTLYSNFNRRSRDPARQITEPFVGLTEPAVFPRRFLLTAANIRAIFFIWIDNKNKKLNKDLLKQ